METHTQPLGLGWEKGALPSQFPTLHNEVVFATPVWGEAFGNQKKGVGQGAVLLGCFPGWGGEPHSGML